MGIDTIELTSKKFRTSGIEYYFGVTFNQSYKILEEGKYFIQILDKKGKFVTTYEIVEVLKYLKNGVWIIID